MSIRIQIAAFVLAAAALGSSGSLACDWKGASADSQDTVVADAGSQSSADQAAPADSGQPSK